MQKIYHLLIICLVAVSFDSVCQSLPKKNNEAMILYTTTIRYSGTAMTQSDTLFVRDSLVLEPIKEELMNSETNVTSQITKTISTRRKLEWYYLTDVSKMAGMAFKVKKEVTRKNIKTFTDKSKDLGYGMSAEPFLFKNGYKVSDYSKVGDTIFNGQKCLVILAKRKIPVSQNGREDALLYTRLFINPQIKNQNYPFISAVLSKHFGGGIVFAESNYESGVNLSMKLEYNTTLTPAYSAIFDKYQNLYLSNITLLDKLKK